MHHVNELILNRVIWVLPLLNQFVHSVYHDHSYKHLSNFELSNAVRQSLCKFCILLVI